MADIFKTIAEIEYRANGDQANKVLDEQFKRVAILEKRYEKLNKMRVSSPAIATDPKFIKVLKDVEDQYIRVRGEAAKTIVTNKEFAKTLEMVVSKETAASLRLTALQKLNRTLPNNRITTEIDKLQGSGVVSYATTKDLVAGAATNLVSNLQAAGGVSDELVNNLQLLGPLFSVAGVGALALLNYLTDESEAMRQARLESEALNEAFGAGKTAAASAGNEIARMTQLIGAAKQGYVDKDAVLKRYNETIGKVIGNTKNLATAEQLIIQQGEAYVKAMQLRATANALFAISQKNLEKAVEEEFKKGTPDVGFFQKLIIGASSLGKNIKGELKDPTNTAAGSFNVFLEDYRKQVQETQKRISTNAANDNLRIADAAFKKGQETIDELIKFAKDNKLDIEELLGLDEDKVKDKLNKIENVFLRELAALKDKIKSAELKIEISPDIINEKFKANLNKELQRLEDFLKKKQLTQAQFTILKGLAEQLNAIELKKALKDYNDEVEKEIKEFTDKITSLQEQSVRKRISFIENAFKREIATIKNEAEQVSDELEKQRIELIKKANDDLEKFTDPVVQAAIRDKINQINKAYADLQTDAETAKFKKLEEAGEKAFDMLKRKLQEASTVADQYRNRELQRALEQEFTSFVNGNQGLGETRRNVTKLQKDAAVDQLRNQLEAAEQQRLLNANRVATSEAEVDKLQLENARLDETIATLRAKIAELLGTNKQEDLDKLIKGLNIGVDISNMIIEGMSKIISTQEAMVDREIAVQERRIERLKETVDRGNAEMLEAEEKRLRQNQALKERYARQQLALQLVQQAGALALAVAQAAALPFPANLPAIGATLTAVFAAFATIKQLNNPVAAFKDGVVDFKGQGDTRSDSNVVRISNRESVMTAEATKNNKDLLVQMNKGRKFVTLDAVGSKSTQKENDHKIEELTEEVKNLREDVKESKGTQVILDKNGVVAIVENVLKSNRVKWSV